MKKTSGRRAVPAALLVSAMLVACGRGQSAEDRQLAELKEEITRVQSDHDRFEQRLSAMLEAIKIVQPTLEDLYGSLTNEQKARFNALGPNIGERSQQQPQQEANAQSTCGEPKSSLTHLPIERMFRELTSGVKVVSSPLSHRALISYCLGALGS